MRTGLLLLIGMLALVPTASQAGISVNGISVNGISVNGISVNGVSRDGIKVAVPARPAPKHR